MRVKTIYMSMHRSPDDLTEGDVVLAEGMIGVVVGGQVVDEAGLVRHHKGYKVIGHADGRLSTTVLEHVTRAVLNRRRRLNDKIREDERRHALIKTKAIPRAKLVRGHAYDVIVGGSIKVMYLLGTACVNSRLSLFGRRSRREIRAGQVWLNTDLDHLGVLGAKVNVKTPYDEIRGALRVYRTPRKAIRDLGPVSWLDLGEEVSEVTWSVTSSGSTDVHRISWVTPAEVKRINAELDASKA